MFVVETMRFKAASVVKVNKLGAVSSLLFLHVFGMNFNFLQLVSNFKCIRTNALDALREISSELIKRAGSEASAEARKALADSCDSLVALGVSIGSSFCFKFGC